MKAPDKIYIDDPTGEFDDHWGTYQNNDSIEYTRADAFMKKAKEGFCKAMCQGKPPRSTCTSLGTCEVYDNFIKYMKGE